MADRLSRRTPNLSIRVPADREGADLVTLLGELADKIDTVVPDRLSKVGRFLGTFATSPADAAAAGVTALQPGDFIFSTGYGCHLVWDAISQGAGSAYGWHQTGGPALIDTAAGGIKGYVTAAQAAGVVGWHNGFLVFDTTLDRMYAGRGGASFTLLGGAQGAVISAGFVAAANWSFTSGLNPFVRSLGNGFALVSAELTRTTSALTVTVTGDVPNESLLTVPAGFEASGTYYTLQAGATGRQLSGSINNAGVVTMTALAPGANVAIGDRLSVFGMYALNDVLGS